MKYSLSFVSVVLLLKVSKIHTYKDIYIHVYMCVCNSLLPVLQTLPNEHIANLCSVRNLPYWRHNSVLPMQNIASDGCH